MYTYNIGRRKKTRERDFWGGGGNGGRFDDEIGDGVENWVDKGSYN